MRFGLESENMFWKKENLLNSAKLASDNTKAKKKKQPTITTEAEFSLPPASLFGISLCLVFSPQNESDKFLCNFGLSPKYTALQPPPKKPYS
jgi:hypothetical protein